MLLEVFLLVVLSWLAWLWKKGARTRELAAKFPGPRAYPIVGNALQFGKTTADIYNDGVKLIEEFGFRNGGSAFRVWLGPILHIAISSPADLEILLGSNQVLDKGFQYSFLDPWLGSGLLTATGSRWKRHRKILTPTFHFKILEQFVDVFSSNGDVLIDKLREHVDGPGFDVYKLITLYTLDNICETAMGVKVNAQNNSDTAYIKAIRNMTDIVMQRSFKPWLAPDFLFNLSSYKKVQDESLKILRDTTTNVIKSRRKEMLGQKSVPDVNADAGDGIKKRLAFLDLLLQSMMDGAQLTEEDIREEVDTFMFEGHDTTSSGISFTLWLLTWHQDIQEKVVQEIKEIFPDPKEPVTFRGLQDLKYTEQVIKESLRLFPSVPIYSRYLNEDLELSNGLVAPKGSTLNILAWMALRNEAVWPDPLKFDPDRFSADNVQGRHPYAFIPFSAGSRNCIGQKFAMLEIKSALVHILRNFRLLPGSAEPDLVMAAELVLVSYSGVKIKVVQRET